MMRSKISNVVSIAITLITLFIYFIQQVTANKTQQAPNELISRGTPKYSVHVRNSIIVAKLNTNMQKHISNLIPYNFFCKKKNIEMIF